MFFLAHHIVRGIGGLLGCFRVGEALDHMATENVIPPGSCLDVEVCKGEHTLASTSMAGSGDTDTVAGVVARVLGA